MEENLTCFEIETLYKSGKKRNEIIVSKDEITMWKYYDEHHNKTKVKECWIADVWCA